MKTLRTPVLVALAALAVTACRPPGEDFYGEYMPNGTETWTINGQLSVLQLSGTLSVREGVDADLTISVGPCIMRADVSGESATLRNGASCTQQVMFAEGPGNVTQTVTAGTLTRAGNVLTLHESGTLSINFQGQTFPGTYTATGTLTRISR